MTRDIFQVSRDRRSIRTYKGLPKGLPVEREIAGHLLLDTARLA